MEFGTFWYKHKQKLLLQLKNAALSCQLGFHISNNVVPCGCDCTECLSGKLEKSVANEDPLFGVSMVEAVVKLRIHF